MSSDYKLSLEWCVETPLKDRPRRSPVYMLNGNEWFFVFALKKITGRGWYYEVYIELKNKRRDLRQRSVKFQVGFKNENPLSLDEGEFEVAEHHEVWCISKENLQSKLPGSGNWIKFLFEFEDAIEPHSDVNREIENTSSDMPLQLSNACLENLSQELGQMLDEGLDSDAVLRCEDHTWNVHKNILSVRSKKLKEVIHRETERTVVITLSGMDVPTAEHFLMYLYRGKLPEMTTETAKRFYEIGVVYDAECLKKSCKTYLLTNMIPENACEMLNLAHENEDFGFKESVMDYIIAKKLVLKNSLWLNFRDSHPRLANEVYDRFCKVHCSE